MVNKHLKKDTALKWGKVYLLEDEIISLPMVPENLGSVLLQIRTPGLHSSSAIYYVTPSKLLTLAVSVTSTIKWGQH